MRIRALGPLEVAERTDLPARDRTVLGVLVVRLGTAVETDEIADAVWADDPPPSYRKVVQGCIVRLRRILGDGAIRTRSSGYELSVPGDDIDVERFATLIERADATLAADDPLAAARAADDALALWRGAPFPELAAWSGADGARQRLTGLREVAEDITLEAALRSGRAEAAATRGEALANGTPYREARWTIVARAQYASGRQADALATLRALRATLLDDLGIDPSPETVAVEAAILHQDRALAMPSAARSGRWLSSRSGRVLAVALVAALLVVVAVALQQNRLAVRAAADGAAAQRSAFAVRLSGIASTRSDPSIALGLSAEALSIADSSEVRARVLDTLGDVVDLMSTGSPPSAPWPPRTTTAASADRRSTASADGASIVLRADGQPMRRLMTPTNDPTALAFSADGRYLAAGMSQLGFAATGQTVVWKVATGVRVATFDSGVGAVWSHVFDATDSSVWSYGEDGIHRWDLTGSHALVRTSSGEAVSFRAGGVVLSAQDTSAAAWIRYLCGLAGGPLPRAAWREYLGDRPYAPTCR